MLIHQTLNAQISALTKRPVHHKKQGVLREELHLLLTLLHAQAQLPQSAQDTRDLQRMTLVCHKKLRELQNLVCCHESGLPLITLDAADFLFQLCCACDLALGSSGKRVSFGCKQDSLPLLWNAKALFAAVMNLLSNAFLHGNGDEVQVLLTQDERRATLQVVSEGECPPEKAQNSRNKIGSGLCAAHCAVKSCAGQLLLVNQRGFCHAVLGFPLPEINEKPFANSDFTDLLCDSLSPVYIGLSGIIPARC